MTVSTPALADLRAIDLFDDLDDVALAEWVPAAVHREAEAGLVDVAKARRVLLRDRRDGLGRHAAFLGDRSRNLDEHDRVGLDETAHAVGCRVGGHRGARRLPRLRLVRTVL